MRFFAKCRRNFGDGALLEKEPMHESVRFTVHKFNSRPKPEDKRRILIITCFSEFGCESIGLVDSTQDVLTMPLASHLTTRVWIPAPHVVEHADHAPAMYAAEATERRGFRGGRCV